MIRTMADTTTAEGDMTEDFYQDPAHLVPAGPARRRQRATMSEMVPVRFPQDMIAAVKRFAALDGMTVSNWIRRLVAKEIERRQPPATVTESAQPSPGIQIHDTQSSRSAASTAPAELVPC
jgi:hypothetical protein